jgi:hypothetical protein
VLAVSTDNVRVMPTWKRDATAYERLSELALLAREQPHKFKRFAIVYIEDLPNGNVKYRTMHNSTSILEIVGMFECGKNDVLDYAKS